MLRDIKNQYSPEFLLGLLNSSAVTFFLKECYGSLAMDGGINFSPANVSEIPVPFCDKRLETRLFHRVERVIADKKDDPDSNTDKLEQEINDLVFELYGLTKSEVAVIEGSALENPC